MGFEFTKSELEEFYCIFGKLQPQANILHYSHYTQLVRSEKNNKKTNKKTNNNSNQVYFLAYWLHILFFSII